MGACCVKCITGQSLEDLQNSSSCSAGPTLRDAQGNFLMPDKVHLRVYGDFDTTYMDVLNTDGGGDVHTAIRAELQIEPTVKIEVYRDDDVHESEAKILEGTTWSENNLEKWSYWHVTGVCFA